MATVNLRRRLAELDAQIVEQKRVLQGLEQNRASIECQLHASASFPVLTLPAEVTAEIFVHCLTLHGMRWSVPTYGIENIAPVVLMGVCRTWRDIALTTPALWSSLDLRFDRFSPEGIPYRVFSKPGLVEGFIDRWLARAGIFPLSLIFGASKYAIEDRFTPSRMRDVIHRYSHRLRYLELDMSLLNVYQLGLDLAEFPLLQSARLGSGLDPDPPPLNIFSNAPRFHQLILPSGTLRSNLTLPWLQLTKYEGTIALDLLTKAVNLTEVTCSFDTVENGPVVTHPRLKSLTLMEGSLDGMIEYLNLPALQYLDISRMTSYYALEPFLTRSSPPLVSLLVRADEGCFEDWHRCVAHVANTLENLTVRQVPHEVVLDLCFGDKSLDALQNIRSLSLQEVWGGVDLYFLVDFLYLRSDKLRSFRLVWRASPFLDRICCSGPRDETVDTIRGHLSRLAHAGMDIYLGTDEKNYAAAIDSTGARITLKL